MKTLYLLRHAKAEPGGKGISDPDRELAPRGREACAAVGAYMKTRKYSPGIVLSSPSARTRQTLELVNKAAGIAAEQRFENTLYLATAGEIIRLVHGLSVGLSSAMVVGHNPGMHHVGLLLSKPEHTKLRTALELKYPTCALAVLRFEGAWEDVAPGTGTLADFVMPREL